jgi:hypothetical protein
MPNESLTSAASFRLQALWAAERALGRTGQPERGWAWWQGQETLSMPNEILIIPSVVNETCEDRSHFCTLKNPPGVFLMIPRKLATCSGKYENTRRDNKVNHASSKKSLSSRSKATF